HSQTKFSILIHHGGFFRKFLGREYGRGRDGLSHDETFCTDDLNPPFDHNILTKVSDESAVSEGIVSDHAIAQYRVNEHIHTRLAIVTVMVYEHIDNNDLVETEYDVEHLCKLKVMETNMISIVGRDGLSHDETFCTDDLNPSFDHNIPTKVSDESAVSEGIVSDHAIVQYRVNEHIHTRLAIVTVMVYEHIDNDDLVETEYDVELVKMKEIRMMRMS
nr:hypothetical protein [Tanacetum cinerariifolium]